MSRIFRRGELRAALIQVLFADGAANGYTIMQRLEDQVGADWRASPGAIYPALLALEDAGQVTGHDDHGSRLYTLTPAGRDAVDSDLLHAIARRASDQESATTLGAVLDAFASEVPRRSAPLDPASEQAVRTILKTTENRILFIIDQGAAK
ncbi:MAG: PadR family transcriptional regulator [Acidimicrobiales bacterium]